MIRTSLLLLAAFSLSAPALATCGAPGQSFSRVGYVANSAVFVEQGETKIIMDMFMESGFGQYRLVPERFKDALTNDEYNFAGIDAVFVSHAHDDHFDARGVIAYMRSHLDVQLYAPKQAVDKMRAFLADESNIFERVVEIDLAVGEIAAHNIGDLKVEAIRIPHSGGARHASVANIVYRVTLDHGVTIMHMGDASAQPGDYHVKEYWSARQTDMAFPPYWLYLSEDGLGIVDTHIHADKSRAIHVPYTVPAQLEQVSEASIQAIRDEPDEAKKLELAKIAYRRQYFDTPGDIKVICDGEGLGPAVTLKQPKPRE